MNDTSNFRLRQQLGIAGRSEGSDPRRSHRTTKAERVRASTAAKAALAKAMQEAAEQEKKAAPPADSPELKRQKKLAREELRRLSRQNAAIDKRLNALRAQHPTRVSPRHRDEIELLRSRKLRATTRKRSIGRWLAQNSSPRPDTEPMTTGQKGTKGANANTAPAPRRHRGLNRNVGVATGTRGRPRPRVSFIG